MGKRYKEKQLAAQAGRRRAVLQIDRVSRREISESKHIYYYLNSLKGSPLFSPKWIFPPFDSCDLSAH